MKWRNSFTPREVWSFFLGCMEVTPRPWSGLANRSVFVCLGTLPARQSNNVNSDGGSEPRCLPYGLLRTGDYRSATGSVWSSPSKNSGHQRLGWASWLPVLHVHCHTAQGEGVRRPATPQQSPSWTLPHVSLPSADPILYLPLVITNFRWILWVLQQIIHPEGGLGKPLNLQLVSEVKTDLWGLCLQTLKFPTVDSHLGLNHFSSCL